MYNIRRGGLPHNTHFAQAVLCIKCFLMSFCGRGAGTHFMDRAVRLQRRLPRRKFPPVHQRAGGVDLNPHGQNHLLRNLLSIGHYAFITANFLLSVARPHCNAPHRVHSAHPSAAGRCAPRAPRLHHPADRPCIPASRWAPRPVPLPGTATSPYLTPCPSSERGPARASSSAAQAPM